MFVEVGADCVVVVDDWRDLLCIASVFYVWCYIMIEQISFFNFLK